MGTSKMTGVPINTPKTSDKMVVGSRVEADNSMDEDDTAAVNDEDKESTLSKEGRSEIEETGSIFCVDAILVVVVN